MLYDVMLTLFTHIDLY